MGRVAQRRASGRQPYLWQSSAATFFTVGTPIGFVLTIGDSAGSSAKVGGAAFLALLTVVIGSLAWRRSPASRKLTYGELMMWAWLRRRYAEEVVDRSVRRLGLDRSGRRVKNVEISSEDQLRMLRQLSEGLEIKDPYTRHHSSRVERHTYRTAIALGLTREDVEVLRRAASVHDVGKIHVDDAILRKPGTLTPEERAEIQKHTAIGARMVRGLGDARIAGAVRHHHERWDGRGYPDGLAGEEIPLYARIIAVADTFDAITSTRAYRSKGSTAKALRIIEEEAGAQFDPRVVEAFLSTVAERHAALGGFLALLLPQKAFAGVGRSVRQLGATSLAPAMASVVAVGLLTPGSGVAPVPAERAVPAPSVQDGWAGSLPERPAPVTLVLSKVDVSPHEDRALVAALRATPAAPSRRDATPPKKTKGASVGGSMSSSVKQAVKPASPPASGPSPEDRGSPPWPPPGDPQPPQDPQPARGNDCSGRGRSDAPGKMLHCGS